MREKVIVAYIVVLIITLFCGNYSSWPRLWIFGGFAAGWVAIYGSSRPLLRFSNDNLKIVHALYSVLAAGGLPAETGERVGAVREEDADQLVASIESCRTKTAFEARALIAAVSSGNQIDRTKVESRVQDIRALLRRARNGI